MGWLTLSDWFSFEPSAWMGYAHKNYQFPCAFSMSNQQISIASDNLINWHCSDAPYIITYFASNTFTCQELMVSVFYQTEFTTNLVGYSYILNLLFRYISHLFFNFLIVLHDYKFKYQNINYFISTPFCTETNWFTVY